MYKKILYQTNNFPYNSIYIKNNPWHKNTTLCENVNAHVKRFFRLS